MGIRRRRRKLTTLMSRLDQRVRSVELRPISLLTTDQINSAVDLGAATAAPDSFVGQAAPNQFYKIEDAYIYPKAVTGTEDRVEIYLEADLDMVKGNRIEVSGIHGTVSAILDADSDNFTVAHTDVPPWDNRTLPKGVVKHDPATDQRSGVIISNAYSFKPETEAPTSWNTFYQLKTKELLTSFSIVGTTVTLTTSSAHKFEAGDVIHVNIYAEDSRAFGDDGLFEIDSVTSTTIVYTLDAGVDTPTGTIDVTGQEIYAFPVARKFCEVGSTWTNSTDGAVYYWDGLRWVSWSTTSLAPNDGDAPNPPTDLVVDATLNVVNGNYNSATVDISWTAPTQSVSGDAINDLVGYYVRWKLASGSRWTDSKMVLTNAYQDDGSSYTWTPGETYDFEVVAFDSGDLKSTALAGQASMPNANTVPLTSLKISTPSVNLHLGTVTLTWDGLMTNGAPPPAGLGGLEIHRSLSETFTATDNTLVGSVSAIKGAKFVDGSLTIGNTYYFKFRLRGLSAGSYSLESDSVSSTPAGVVDANKITQIIANAGITPGTIVTGDNIIGMTITGELIQGNEINGNIIKANSITANKIDVGNLAADIVSSGYITTRPTEVSSGITLDSNGLTAYNGTTQTFRINSSDGAVTIGSYATTDTVNNVSNLASTANSTATTANSTATTANSTATGVASNVYYPGTTEINGGNIRTGTVDASSITADSVLAGTIKTGPAGTARIEIRGSAEQYPGIVSFDGAGGTNFRFYNDGRNYLDNVEVAGTLTVSGNITGGLIRTSSGSKRVELDGPNNALQFYSGGVLKGEIEGLTAGVVISGSSGAALTVSGSAIDSNVKITTNGLFSEARVGQSIWVNTGTGSYTVNRNASGDLVPTTSDARLKTDITEIDNALNRINRLNPVTFKWKNDDSNPIRTPGLIAQEVADVFSEDEVFLVHRLHDPEAEGDFAADPVRSLEYINLVPYLIKAVQELSVKNDELQARIATLEGN